VMSASMRGHMRCLKSALGTVRSSSHTRRGVGACV